MWTYGVGTGRLTPNEFVAVTSTNIARILNLYPRKGAILPGADADLVVWDPKASKTISAANQQSIIDYNVFEGVKVKGLPRYTLSRGSVVFEDGRVLANNGRGRFVKREPFSPESARARQIQAIHRAEGGRALTCSIRRPTLGSAIDIAGVSLTFQTSDGPVQALSGVDLRIAQRRVRLVHRPLGLRQDDAAARRRRSGERRPAARSASTA